MRILISGGGTGGHVYPGVAVAGILRKKFPGVKILFIGTAKGAEADIIPKEGYHFRKVVVEGLPRKISLQGLKSMYKLGLGTIQAISVIKHFKPDVVLGTGGYVCAPVVLAANLLGVPTVLHEQNAIPGITNKFLSRFAKYVCITYEDSKKYFPKRENIFLTGNPVRTEVLTASREDAFRKLGLDETMKTILVFGGSRGARSINKAMLEAYPYIFGKFNCQVIHMTGKDDYPEIDNAVNKLCVPEEIKRNIHVKPYIYNMPDALAVADLIICRAGATTIAEITARGIPSIIIPYPYATDNHQEFNARALEREKAAVLIHDKELNGRRLGETVITLFSNPELFNAMGQYTKNLSKPTAAESIVNLLLKVKK